MTLSEQYSPTTPALAPDSQKFYLILFPASFEERIEALLDDVGVPGYSRAPDVVGRGPRGRHFNNPIWPGAIGEIFTAVDDTCGARLSQQLKLLNAAMHAESRGHYGLHVLSWPCDSLL